VNDWTSTIITTVVIAAVFGYLWWAGHVKALADYVAQTREELRKCSWPTWEELKGSTVLIIIMVALLGLFVVVTDRLLFAIFIH
jgi:preprotein translocase subunit SecE